MLTISFFSLFMVSASAAIDNRACMSIEQARVVSNAERIIPLDKALQSAKRRRQGDVISAKLCRVGPHMVYVLTMLTPDSKVIRVAVDAHTGAATELN